MQTSDHGTVGTCAKGNTKTIAHVEKKKRNWCFTWNNYPSDWVLALAQALDISIDINQGGAPLQQASPCGSNMYVIGLEVGEEGTPHLQGYVEFKNARYFSALKKALPKVHWEPAWAKQCRIANYNYCSKGGNFYTNIVLKEKKTKTKKLTLQELAELEKKEVLKEEYDNITWLPWQQTILDMIKTKPDKRKIYWYFEETGNKGKSFLCKYADCIHKGVVFADGKKGDVFNQIVTVWEEEQVVPRIVLLDIPRDSRDWINIGTLETIKNGLLYSGKFKGGKVNMRKPHIIIFANTPPDEDEYEKLSKDRWEIFEILENNELKKHEIKFEKSIKIRKNN